MKVIQANCRVQFTAEDVEFILAILGAKAGTSETLVGLLADEDTRDLILDNPNGPDNRSQARYLANTGADWWRTTTAPFGDGTNNPGVGQSRFTYVTSNWTAINP